MVDALGIRTSLVLQDLNSALKNNWTSVLCIFGSDLIVEVSRVGTSPEINNININ